MSKRVRGVMRVMMIGMVAMLAATAEGHYIVLKGVCYWHSGECTRKDEDVPTDVLTTSQSVQSIQSIPQVDLVLTPKRVEILCLNGNVQVINLSGNAVNLAAAPAPIVQGDITERRDLNGKIISRNLEVTRIVSDALFLENPADLGFCPGSTPTDVIIRRTSAQMNLYCDPLADTKECLNKTGPHSSWRAECKLPGRFNFDDYPQNLPARGTPYNCSNITCHDDGGGLKCVAGP